MAGSKSKITVSAIGEVSLGTGDNPFRLKGQMQVFGGPVSFSVGSVDSFSIDEIWDLISKGLDDTFGVSLPSVPDGPWNALFSTQIYPSLWLEPSGDEGPNVHLQLTFEDPVTIGGSSHIGPVEISIDPTFTVNSVMIGYDKKTGLGLSASVTMPTTLPKPNGTGEITDVPAKKGEVTKVVSYPFPIPAQKSKPAFQVHYLGLGQRIGPKPVLDTSSEDPLTEIFDTIEKVFTVNDPKAVLTSLANDFYDPKLGWFIAADIEIKSFRIKVLFNDPSMYGLEIAVADTPPTFLSGFKFEILYQKIGPNLGVYYAAIVLPTALRRIPLEAFILILPGFSIWIYTNGDFRINVGWPVGKNSIGISWEVLTGYVGFYFAKLRSGDNPGANPNVDFNPILALGIGFRLEAGVDIDAGVFTASLSISVTVTMQGLLAWKDEPGNSIAKAPDAYWFAGTFEVQVLIKGAVDFVVIKASITISFSFGAEIAVENSYGTELIIHAQVTARASVKVVFFTVHFSFHTSITHKMTLTHGAAGIASVKGPQQDGLRGLLGSPDPLERMMMDQISDLRMDLAPLMRALDDVLVPPHRLAPELRSAGRIMARSGFDDDGRVTVNAKFVLQSTALYDIPGAKKEDPATNAFGAIGLILLGGRDPGSTPDDTTRTDFEDLVARMVCWLLNAAPPPQSLDELLSQRLDKLLTRLKATKAIDFSFEIKAFFDQHVTFSVTGVDGAVPPSTADQDRTWTVLPMFDLVEMTTNGTARNFNTYQPIPDNYEKAVDLYFEGLSLFGEKPDVPLGARAALPEPVKTMGGFLFADYYLMLAQHVITELHVDAVAYEKAAKKTLQSATPETQARAVNQHVLDTDDQTELDALLDAFDYASAAGLVSRALMGGQQLPEPAKVPKDVTPDNIHNVPVSSIYACSGQQIAVDATGAAQTATATLALSPGVDAPSWLELVPAGKDKPLTSTLPLPAVVPDKPVPNWTGNGLGLLSAAFQPAGDAGSIEFKGMDPIASVGLKFTTRSQTVWSAAGGDSQAIVQLPTPLLTKSATQDGLTATLAVAQNQGSTTPPEPVSGTPGLTFDLPVSQVNNGRTSASDQTEDSGVVANLYQIWATDDVSRERIRQVIDGHHGPAVKPTITLLYLDKDGTTMASDTLDPGVLLSRSNLSTENQAKTVSARMLMRTATPDTDPPFARLASDPLGFLRLIWEVSVVNATGFYLFYRTDTGTGLPARLFAQTGMAPAKTESGNSGPKPEPIAGTNGATATLRVLVQFLDAPQASVPLANFANCVIAKDFVDKPASIAVFDAAGMPLPSWHSRLSAGELGFELDWTDQNTAPPAEEGQINPAALYHLLQFNVQDQSGTAGAVWSLPLSPVQDTSKEEKGGVKPDLSAPPKTQIYQQAFPAYRFLSKSITAAGATNVYALVGENIGLKYRLTDMFGNALVAQATATETGFYHDPLFNVTQWPMVQGSHYFTPPIDGSTDQGLLVVCLTFDSEGLDALTAAAASKAAQSGSGDNTAQLLALLRKYTLIQDQVTDAGTSYTLTSSLLGGTAAGQDIATDLQEFVSQILDQIKAQISGAVPVNAKGKVDPLTRTLQVPVPFSTVSGLQDNILAVTTSVITKRDAHLWPGIQDKLPEAVESIADIPPRRGQKFPDFTKPRTKDQLCAVGTGGDPAATADGKSSMIAYARNFEAAFKNFNGKNGMMKLAERAGLIADADSDAVATLWAVRFAGTDTTGPGITVSYQPDDITYYALPPLNTEPVTRTVDSTTYNGIDMDAWSRRTFSAIDRLFEPELNVAIAQLDNSQPPDTSASETLSTAKSDIAKAVPKSLELVLVDSPDGNKIKATDQLEQAMLTRLSAAYSVSTVMQVPADVTVRNADGPSSDATSRPPELFGRIGPPLLDSKSEDKSKVFDLSSGRLDVANGTQWSTVMVTVTDQREHRSLKLGLEYDISALQHDFETSEEFDGYTPSSWLSFVLPGGVLTTPITGKATADIPIPLPFEPPTPSLTSQTAVGSKMQWKPGDSLSKLIEDALRWDYKPGLKTKLAAQDQLYLDAIFGIGAVTPHIGSGAKKKPINTALFDAMARFLDGWAKFEPQIQSIIQAAIAKPPVTDDQDKARKAIADITPLVEAVAAAWNAVQYDLRLAPEEPELIHYRLQIDRSQETPEDIIMTLDGWTADNTGSAVKPGRWPVIFFTPQSSGDDIPPWEIDGSSAEKHMDGTQAWWRVTKPATAKVFPENFLFDWEGLDLSKRQLGRLQTWTRRNAQLVEKHDTRNDFIYETSVVSFASPGIPLIERNALQTVAPDPDSTLYSVLLALLQPLNFGDATLQPFIRLHANLRYTLATPVGPGAPALEATYPLILQPNLVLSETDGVPPDTAALSLATGIAGQRAGFQGRGGDVYLDLALTLFGSNAGQQVPLITIDPLSLDVTKVPEKWWTPPKTPGK